MLFEVYKAVGTNREGEITPDNLSKQLRESEIFSDPGIALKASQALISRMDLTGNGSISFSEFARVFVLLPDCDVELIFKHWAKYSHIDMGEDYSLPDEPSVEKSRINIFISGAIAGCISRCVTAPIDRLKVIMQAGKGDATIINMMRYMYQEGGLRGMWRGNGMNCLKIAPESASRFLCYGEFKHLVTKMTGGDENAPTVVEKFIAGGSAGAFSQALVYPLEITKTRLALSKTGLPSCPCSLSPSPLGQYNGVLDVVSSIVNQGGLAHRRLSPLLVSLSKGGAVFIADWLPLCSGSFPMQVPPHSSLLALLTPRLLGIDLMVFNTLKERWVAENVKHGENKSPDVMTLVPLPSPSLMAYLLTQPSTAPLWGHLHHLWSSGGVPLAVGPHPPSGRQTDGRTPQIHR
jgi:solute carrier family 25 (mitochondrial phosphate transporter), member 23/24/25/41